MGYKVITNAIIFTVNATDDIIRNGSIIYKDGILCQIEDTDHLIMPDDVDEIIDLEGKYLVMPGLIDIHTHSSLFRGVAENMKMWEWLPHYDLEHRSINEQDAYYASKLSYLEALRNGTTCIMDMYREMHMCAKAAGELGIRAHLAPYTADNEPYDFFDTLDQNIMLYKTHHNSCNGRIKVWMGLENIFYCSPKMFRDSMRFAIDNGIRLHTHACEQEEEEQTVIKQFGKTTVGVMNDYGILGEKTVLAHCVWVSDDDIAIMADTGTSVGHCPTAAAKLACGIARSPLMKQKGVNVGLGSDGPTCNNSMDLFQEMKFGSLIQKAAHTDPTIFSAKEMIRMATIQGAKALGMEDEIGSLEEGKSADMIIVDINKPNLQPIFWNEDGSTNLEWNIVFSAQGSNVDTVIVQGDTILKNKMPTKVCEIQLIDEVQKQADDWMIRRKYHEQFISKPLNENV